MTGSAGGAWIAAAGGCARAAIGGVRAGSWPLGFAPHSTTWARSVARRAVRVTCAALRAAFGLVLLVMRVTLRVGVPLIVTIAW